MAPNNQSAVLAAGEEKRIQDALDALVKDPHSPREITVRYILNVHREYPKHVGSRIVNNAAEEKALTEEIAANLPEVSGQFATGTFGKKMETARVVKGKAE